MLSNVITESGSRSSSLRLDVATWHMCELPKQPAVSFSSAVVVAWFLFMPVAAKDSTRSSSSSSHGQYIRGELPLTATDRARMYGGHESANNVSACRYPTTGAGQASKASHRPFCLFCVTIKRPVVARSEINGCHGSTVDCATHRRHEVDVGSQILPTFGMRPDDFGQAVLWVLWVTGNFLPGRWVDAFDTTCSLQSRAY